jgi:superfamily II DNA or RNA helicase
MDKLIVRKKNHAFLHIECEPSIHNELTDFFAFRPEGYQFVPSYRNKMWDGFLRLYSSYDKQLPIGLFAYLDEFCGSRSYSLEVEYDNYYGLPNEEAVVDYDFFNDLTFTSKGKKIEHRDYQQNAIYHCLHNRNALIISPTASGKSLIIYSLMRYYLGNFNKDILIVVPTTSLIKQMFFDFGDYSEYDDTFNNTDECHLIYSGQEKKSDKRIVISTWQSIYKLPQQWFSRFGMVVVDEAHTAAAKSLSSIMGKLKEAEYRFGTTGTIKEGQKVNKLQLEGSFGKAYYVTTTKDLMDSGALAQLSINVVLLKYAEEKCREVIKLKYQEEIDYIVRLESRNKFIRNLALDQDGNTLVLFQFVDKHGKPLYEMIKEKAHERRKIFYVSGETDVDTREEIRHITESQKNAIIVASLGTFSTGINIKNIHNIIFASPSKSQIKILQSIGRGLRVSDDGRETKLFDLADDFHWKSKRNYALEHSAERIKLYSREKFKYNIYEVKL